MSAIAAGPRAGVAAPRSAALADRFLAALPLLIAFVWLCLLYCWESWGHVTPWLFGDELETAQLARSIAETGHAARRGVPHPASLAAYLFAPAFWFSSMETAYATVKYVGAVVMTCALFPTYFLARMVVPKPLALLAGTLAAAGPALVYSPMLLEEPLAYPWTALCFLLGVRAIATRRRGWILAAVTAAFVAPLVRDELTVIPALLVLAALFRWWGSERMRAWRATWSAGDWIGAFTLLAGVVIVLNAWVSHHVYAWLIATLYYKGRMIDYGLWAAGALTIGLGVFPVVAGLASLFRPRGAPATENERAFTCVAAAALIGFGYYTAVKAAYISTTFSTLVEERNLIYVAPLLAVGTSLVLARARVRALPAAAAAGLALYLVLTTPYQMQLHFYGDAPGLGILQAANRTFGWTPHYARTVLVGMVIVSLTLLVLPRYLRSSPRTLGAFVAVVGVAVLAWNVTAQVSAASGSKSQSDALAQNLDKPWDWLDRATGGAPTIYIGQQIEDANGIYELEFWNRSLRYMWSLDGTAKGPGPVLTPDLGKLSGRLVPAPPDARYVVTEEGIDVVGTPVTTHGHESGGSRRVWTLVKITPPLRLAHAATGVTEDGWMGNDSFYSQYATPGNEAGYAVVKLSRKGWGGKDTPGNVTVRVGTLAIGKDKQPAFGRVTAVRRWTIHSKLEKTFVIPAPRPPFRVWVHVDRTFVPHDLDPSKADTRHVSATVGFGFRARPAK